MAVRSISSELMSKLLVWRNCKEIPPFTHIKRIIATEIALSLLLILSTVEIIVYPIIFGVLIFFKKLEETRYPLCLKLLQSSTVIIPWTIYAMISNLFSSSLETHESLIRAEMAFFSPRLFNRCLRHEDHTYAEVLSDQDITEGALLLTSKVLADASPESIANFQACDLKSYSFILTKAVYLYAVGTEKAASVPKCFKPFTRMQIRALRRHTHNKEVLDNLAQVMCNPEAFDRGITGAEGKILQATKAVFTKLSGAAAEELQNGHLITECWQQAVQLLS